MIIKTLYHSSWPYGLSSLLTDCIKNKHLDQRQKKKPQQQSLVRAIHATQSVLNYIHLEKCEKKFFSMFQFQVYYFKKM
jgi:hypothetical protein